MSTAKAGGCEQRAGGLALHDYTDLDIWRRSMDIAERVYRLTEALPLDERFGLVSQLRRAAVSVPSNIAEGCGHGRGKACANFIRHARGSVSELRTQITLTVRLGMIAEERIGDLMGECDILQAQLMRFIQTQEEER